MKRCGRDLNKKQFRHKWDVDDGVGHTLRRTNSNITKKAFVCNLQGSRDCGRPRGTWKRVMDEDINRSGNSWQETRNTAQDRAEWK